MLELNLHVFFINLKLCFLRTDSLFFRFINIELNGFKVISLIILKNKKAGSFYLLSKKKTFKLRKI